MYVGLERRSESGKGSKYGSEGRISVCEVEKINASEELKREVEVESRRVSRSALQ